MLNEKDLRAVEKEIKDYWELEGEWNVELVSEMIPDENDGEMVTLMFRDTKDKNNRYCWCYIIEENATVEDLIKNLIAEIYECEINERNSYIREWKRFCTRKAMSLTTWLQRENIEKVDKINREIVGRHKQTEEYKTEVRFFKVFVNALYAAKKNFEGEKGEVA